MAYSKPKKVNKRKKNRELVLNISMYLLSAENLRNLFWNVKNVDYDRSANLIKIGINTTKKLGTTLNKLRGHRKGLSNYLFEQGITNRRLTKVEFYVDREEEVLARIYNLISEVES